MHPHQPSRLLLTLLLATASLSSAAKAVIIRKSIARPFNTNDTAPVARGLRALQAGLPIQYYGGPVMRCKPTVYYIAYGRIDPNQAALFSYLAQNLGGSSYYNIMTTYYDTAGPVLNVLGFGGWAQYLSVPGMDPYGLGRVLQDAQVAEVVTTTLAQGKSAVGEGAGVCSLSAYLDRAPFACACYYYNLSAMFVCAGALPKDPNGIYLVIMPQDAMYAGLCTDSCGVSLPA